MFNENSVTVKVWVDLVKEGRYKKEQVPKLFNLKDVVLAILDKLDEVEQPTEKQPVENK